MSFVRKEQKIRAIFNILLRSTRQVNVFSCVCGYVYRSRGVSWSMARDQVRGQVVHGETKRGHVGHGLTDLGCGLGVGSGWLVVNGHVVHGLGVRSGSQLVHGPDEVGSSLG